MNWEAIGAIGEVVGAIGVIVTLGYLAFQIRQNTGQLRRNEQHTQTAALDETVRSFSQWREQISSDRATAEIWVRGLADPSNLDEVDRIRFDYLLATLFYSFQATYRRAKNAGSPETWENGREVLAAVLSNPGAARYWAAFQNRFLDDFVRDINGYLN